MAKADKFRAAIVATLARRASDICSNPDCGAITSGPSKDRGRAVNVGEAAHIYGAQPGAARYDPSMLPAARSGIENAIWLCSNCHAMIDRDPLRFPAGLLFEWQREHEHMIAMNLGKAGAETRRRYEERHLEEFGRLSYLAERLILEKGDYWEFHLTVEVLRTELDPILARWDALKRGLYLKSSTLVDGRETPRWLMTRMTEAQRIASAFGQLLNLEFGRAWGEPGVPGDDRTIVATCRLYAEVCASALEWEETVRFAALDSRFTKVQDLMLGVTGCIIDEAARLPEFVSEIVKNPTAGTHRLDLEVTLPDQWVENVSAAMNAAVEDFLSR